MRVPVMVKLTAPNALAGLDLLSRAEFDIVMVDIEMPGMDGIEMVQRIRADEKLRRLPLVMVTGREDIVSIDRAYASRDALLRLKVPTVFREYEMGHEVRLEALREIVNWLEDKVLSPIATASR